MPFNGLSLFLQTKGGISNLHHHMYQCPLTGFLYFYETQHLQQVAIKNVSMPFNGLSLFLQMKYTVRGFRYHCINAL